MGQQAKNPGFSVSRRIATAKVREFTLNSKFTLGYRNREDKTTLPPGVLIVGSQNVLTDVTGRVGITKGYALDGASSSTLTSIMGAYDWEVQANGFRHLRSIQPTTTNGTDGKLQWRYVSPTGVVTWTDLITGLSSGKFNFAEWYDKTNFQPLLLMVNSSSGIWEWTGATGTLNTATNAAGGISAVTFNQTGANPNLGGTGYSIGDILTLAGGTGGQVKVTSIVTNTVQAIAISNAGSGYAVNDIVTILSDQTAFGVVNATAKVTSTGGGGTITGIQLLTQGSGGSVYYLHDAGYATGIHQTTTGGGGGGATINVTSLGINSVATISLYAPGSGYSTGNAVATTNTGTGATVNITTVATGQISITGSQTVAQSNFYLTSGTLLINGHSYNYSTVSGNVFLGVSPDASAEPAGSVIVQQPKFSANSTFTNGMGATFANDLISTLYNQAYVGSLASNQVWVSSNTDYKTFTQSSPRTPGQGALFTLSANTTALVNQEDAMYLSCGNDDWFQTIFTLSSDNSKEQLSVSKLKTTTQQAAQSQAWTSNIRNNVVFLSNEPILNSLGRVDNVVLTPQVSDLSHTIINDMTNYDFTDGSVFYWRNYILMAIPKESIVRVYNMTNPVDPAVSDVSNPNFYWEAPLTFPVSRFSIIDGDLYGHSYQTPESYKLFTGYNFNKHPIDARAIFSYQNDGIPAESKSFNKFYVEGYISSNATIDLNLMYELNGQAGASTFPIVGTDTSIVEIVGSTASLGKTSLGKNPLGGDLAVTDGMPPKFRVIETFTRTPYYEYSPSFTSVGTDFNWSILRFGSASSPTSEGNNFITH